MPDIEELKKIAAQKDPNDISTYAYSEPQPPTTEELVAKLHEKYAPQYTAENIGNAMAMAVPVGGIASIAEEGVPLIKGLATKYLQPSELNAAQQAAVAARDALVAEKGIAPKVLTKAMNPANTALDAPARTAAEAIRFKNLKRLGLIR